MGKYIFSGVFFVLLIVGGVSLSRVYGQGANPVLGATGIIGKVISIANKTLTVIDKKGLSQNIVTDSTTKILGENKAIRSIANIKTGDTVGAVFATDSGVATQPAAAKIATKLYIKEGSPSGQQKALISGVITGVNNAVVTVLVKDAQMFYNVAASDSAIVKIGNIAGAMSNLELGQRVVVVGTGSQDAFNASLLHAITK